MTKAKKSLGQHFLNNPRTAERIANAISPEARSIIEVGPGPGMLTDHILQRNGDLTFIEKDDRFARQLEEETRDRDSVRVIHDDFLRVDLSSVTQDPHSALVGNFPYNISSQIVFRMLEYRHLISEMVGMFQLEMAKRIVSPPRSKDFSVISVLTQTSYQGRILFHVSPGQFTPPPKVTSAVIRLERKQIFEPPCNEAWLRRITKAAFNQRRKMLRNSLKPFFSGSDILNSDLFTRRPEQLEVESFFELADLAEKHSNPDI